MTLWTGSSRFWFVRHKLILCPEMLDLLAFIHNTPPIKTKNQLKNTLICPFATGSFPCLYLPAKCKNSCSDKVGLGSQTQCHRITKDSINKFFTKNGQPRSPSQHGWGFRIYWSGLLHIATCSNARLSFSLLFLHFSLASTKEKVQANKMVNRTGLLLYYTLLKLH